jgi:hypothetical protein
MPACTKNDLLGTTFTNLAGAPLSDYTYYANTEGEKVFSYLLDNEPECLGYTYNNVGQTYSQTNVAIGTASLSLVQVYTSSSDYSSCVSTQTKACFYHDMANKQFKVTIYGSLLNGDNTIKFGLVMVGLAGTSASDVVYRLDSTITGMFTLTVQTGGDAVYCEFTLPDYVEYKWYVPWGTTELVETDLDLEVEYRGIPGPADWSFCSIGFTSEIKYGSSDLSLMVVEDNVPSGTVTVRAVSNASGFSYKSTYSATLKMYDSRADWAAVETS